MRKTTFLFVLLIIGSNSVAPARAAGRQNLLEYVTAKLSADAALSPAEKTRLLAAIKDRFADYAATVVPANDTAAADVVMRMIVEGTFDETPPERIAEVSFEAFQAISRGAPVDVVEGIALYGYRKKIPGDRISLWANGYKNLTDAKVPPEIAADLVRNAMERDWDDRTFMLLKQNLYQAAKERFAMHDYAVYLFGNMLTGKKMPGALCAESLNYFRKLAKTKAKPVLPPYEGVFSQKPMPEVVYEAKPQEPQTAPVIEPAAPEKQAPAVPPPSVKPTPRELGVAMDTLWPGLSNSARSYLGTPYVWGGVTHQGIDCSAFTQNSYGENRVSIPRVSRQQWKTGETIAWKDLREGDLVFFNTMGAGVSHVGMVMDGGKLKFMHASSSHGVMQADLNKNYYKARYLGARRIVP